ncbi:hypothetical protein I3679_022700 [Proteus mirabilis]|uniref:Uncharacterized protein n=1 Tax=Proteus mirabilis TaxID=584 RepID=A0ABD5LVW3_PROMI|nr:hypothetical protein [Proteus mirabilis]
MLINDIKISGDKNILSGNLLFMCIPLNDEYPIRIYDDKTTKIIKGKAFIYNSKMKMLFFNQKISHGVLKRDHFYLCQIIGIY